MKDSKGLENTATVFLVDASGAGKLLQRVQPYPSAVHVEGPACDQTAVVKAGLRGSEVCTGLKEA